ncbi:hypothetical protein [Bacillus sp. AK031]
MEEQLQQTIKELEVSLQELENARSENVLVQHYIQEEKKEIKGILEKYYGKQPDEQEFKEELISYFWIGTESSRSNDWSRYSRKSLY